MTAHRKQQQQEQCYTVEDLEKRLATGPPSDWSLSANGFTQDSNIKQTTTHR